MSKPIVLVAGIPNAARFLQETSFFEKVYEITKVSELKKIVTSTELKNVNRAQITFVCGDSIDEDDPSLTMGDFLRKITTAGYNTIVVSVTAKGAELQRQNPRSKLLQVPMTLNDLLYAISSFGYPISPVDEGGFTIPVHPLQFNTDLNNTEKETSSENNSASSTNWVSAPSSPQETVSSGTTAPNPWSSSKEAVEKPLAGPAWTPAPVANKLEEKSPVPTSFSETPTANQELDTNSDGDSLKVEQEVTPQNNWIAPPPIATQQNNNQSTVILPPDPASYQANPVKKTLSGIAPPPPSQAGWQQGPGMLAPQSRIGNEVAEYGAKRRGFVITVSTSKGGTGKSSLSLNLAAFLGMRIRAQGKTVCIIDANTQQADTGKYLDVYRPNINTIVNDPSLLTEESIMSALVHKPEYNLSALLGPATPDEANPLAISARLYSQVLDLLRKHFDYIIIDTAVAEKFHEMFSQFALPKADYIIVPVAPNFATLHNADNWLRSAVAAPKHEGGAGIDPSRIGIVLNRAEEGIGCSEADVRATLASWHFIGAVPETKEWKAANNRNELIAPKNYAELSHSFAEVLHAATREPILTENFALMDSPKQGFVSKFKKVLGRG